MESVEGAYSVKNEKLKMEIKEKRFQEKRGRRIENGECRLENKKWRMTVLEQRKENRKQKQSLRGKWTDVKEWKKGEWH